MTIFNQARSTNLKPWSTFRSKILVQGSLFCSIF